MIWQRLVRRRRRARPVPTWEGTAPGTRVLVEHPDPGVRDVLERSLGEHGYRVVTCSGPHGVADQHVTCPVLLDQPCPAIGGADAIVCGLDLQDATNRDLVVNVLRSDPGLPMLLAADLRVTDPLGKPIGPHRLYRTMIAPLVRRLHRQLAARPADDPPAS